MQSLRRVHAISGDKNRVSLRSLGPAPIGFRILAPPTELPEDDSTLHCLWLQGPTEELYLDVARKSIKQALI